jgi:hypothetical protein
MEKPIITEAFNDDGSFSHWRLINPENGELIWTENPEEDKIVHGGFKQRKKLVELRTKLKFYQKLEKKIDKCLNAELELDEWSSEVYYKISSLENELSDLKIEMDLPDEEWDD